MDPLTFASSQNEESDFAAERRWESQGGIPGQNFNSYCVMNRKEDATTARHAEGILLRKVNGTCI
jgi:hypothetical protein